MAPFHIIIFLLLVSISATSSLAHRNNNITAVLSPYPDYSLFTSYLSQTRLSDEIDSLSSEGDVTILVLPNSAASSLASAHSLAAIKNSLRLLVLLSPLDPADYLRGPHHHKHLSVPTLLPSVPLNISSNGTHIAFGPTHSSYFTRSVLSNHHPVSVLEISSPITIPGQPDPVSIADANVTRVLEGASCGDFARLAAATGVLARFLEAIEKGALTVLAPRDEAFRTMPRDLTREEMVSLLEYHAILAYAPEATLAAMDAPVETMAGFVFTVEWNGDEVVVDSGVSKARVVITVLDDAPVCIMIIDALLLPPELFPVPPASAPAPAPALAPSRDASVPVPAPGSPFVVPVHAPTIVPVAEPPMELVPAPTPGKNATVPDVAAAVAVRPGVLIAAAALGLIVVA